MKINQECDNCPLVAGCFLLCVAHPKDVIQPPCEKYAIGLAGKNNDGKQLFWTRPAENWKIDKENPRPKDLEFVII